MDSFDGEHEMTYVGGVDLDFDSEDDDETQVGESLSQREPPSNPASLSVTHSAESVAPPPPQASPPPPPHPSLPDGAPPPPGEYTPSMPHEEPSSLLLLQEMEIAERAMQEAEAYSHFLVVLRAMSAARDYAARQAEARRNRLQEETEARLAEVFVLEMERRREIAEGEEDAWGLIMGLSPLIEDIKEAAKVTERRRRRRQRKLDRLKQLYLDAQFRAEWERELAQKRKDMEWAAYIQKIYVRDGMKLQEQARKQIYAKIAEAEREVGLHDMRRSGPTLYQHLVATQKAMALESRELSLADVNYPDISPRRAPPASPLY